MDAIETTATTREENFVVPVSQVLPVNELAVRDLENQRKILSKFVESQLKEAVFLDSRALGYGEGDYGIIPGTKKRCLFKQGAEKILRLFGLGVRFRQTDKEFDRNANFALYTYRAEVYILKTGLIIADCEATANSQEIKYKEKTEWSKNSKGVSESKKVETPICDIINTLQKMAQKRALVGATLLATGASEYFTQDMLEPEFTEENQNQNEAPKQESAPAPTGEAPTCCGKKMYISKFVDQNFGHAPFYCGTCKKKVAAQ
jgi:hypothetical protein